MNISHLTFPIWSELEPLIRTGKQSIIFFNFLKQCTNNYNNSFFCHAAYFRVYLVFLFLSSCPFIHGKGKSLCKTTIQILDYYRPKERDLERPRQLSVSAYSGCFELSGEGFFSWTAPLHTVQMFHDPVMLPSSCSQPRQEVNTWDTHFFIILPG